MADSTALPLTKAEIGSSEKMLARRIAVGYLLPDDVGLPISRGSHDPRITNDDYNGAHNDTSRFSAASSRKSRRPTVSGRPLERYLISSQNQVPNQSRKLGLVCARVCQSSEVVPEDSYAAQKWCVVSVQY